mgnify:CR=1 FL=1
MCEWKLGVDLSPEDNILDGITFYDLIIAVHCNCQTIDDESVKRTFHEILSQRRQDMMYLLKNNMEEIIEAAKRGRSE